MRSQQQTVNVALDWDTPSGVPGTICTIAKLSQEVCLGYEKVDYATFKLAVHAMIKGDVAFDWPDRMSKPAIYISWTPSGRRLAQACHRRQTTSSATP